MHNVSKNEYLCKKLDVFFYIFFLYFVGCIKDELLEKYNVI